MSETSPRRVWARRLFAVLVAAVVLGWLVVGVTGRPLAEALAGVLGGTVQGITDGKIRGAAPFLLHRMHDALWIGTAVLGIWGLNRLAVPRLSRGAWAWLPLGTLFFVEANVLLAVLARTGLFWLAMYAGDAGRHDVTRFYVRQAIAQDVPADTLIAIIGNSQAGTQINEDLISDALGDQVYAARMNFPAAKPYSLLLLQDDFEEVGTDAMVLYLSELSFLRGATMEHIPLFASVRGMQDFEALGGDPEWDTARIRYGWISTAVPAFRLRSVLMQRVLGRADQPAPFRSAPGRSGEATEAADDLDDPDASFDTQAPDFLDRVERRASMLVYGDQEDFQYRALELFAERADAAGVDLYLLPGTVHPALARQIPLAARPKMIAALRALAARLEHVYYVEEDRLPYLDASDFKDPVHGSKLGQTRFTTGLIEVLRTDLVGERHPLPAAVETREESI